MLDAGFGTLDYLKSRILPAGAVQNDEWDAALQKLGLAVARKMNGHCNRVLERTEDLVDEFSALNLSVVLRAFPVETVTGVDLRAWNGTVGAFDGGYQLDKSAGLMTFQGNPGDGTERLVITYTGGYWLDDGDTMPTDATPLPDDLLEAWVAQCQVWAEARQMFGTIALAGLEEKKTPNRESAIRLSDEVKEILNHYRRFAGE